MAGSKKSGGRKPGIPNKATTEAREAIARFVDKNAGRLQGWLDKIAEKDAEKAFTLFQSVIEYHVPKLARTDVNNSGEVALKVEIVRLGAGTSNPATR